ncbi:hypothetical protein [Cellulomonas wangsupingiae]|uniref:DUF998 domain-containing protein n=1 Tax=Cellulomonas wangsupingiae TaxID=2968085 RepID=A0ABY5K7N8_9CELL|nr:hypothetical protein [Cellulomonas wangsupingiae]MCC2333818.1 hypothetical protein [Cellulomonas wangsupingiae]UUI65080.1 hypothetical protein NP075_18535 [Cellulomonas wangsupingiae]
MSTGTGGLRPSRTRLRLLALLLFLVAPVCAEYLTAYDPEVTGQPAALIGGLVIIGPLYGAPAVLIRELAARTGMHWTGILAMAGAFGVVQAGVVDQSLFAQHYPGYAWWGQVAARTLIPPLGVSGAFALNFLLGHVIWSISAPVALVEALDRRPGRQPWLGRVGLVVLGVLWALASVLVWSDIRGAGSDQASAAQIAAALALAAALVAVAFTFGRRRLPAPTEGRVPRPAMVLGLVLVAAAGYQAIPSTWLGVALGTAVVLVVALVVTRWSRSASWGPRHAAAVAGAAVVARALVGFQSVASTDPQPPGGFAQNTVLLVTALALVVAAMRAGRPATQDVGGE